MSNVIEHSAAIHIALDNTKHTVGSKARGPFVHEIQIHALMLGLSVKVRQHVTIASS